MSRPEQKTILLVENEALASMSRAKDLENFGYSIIQANTGEQAIELAGKTPGIDLILLDMEPGGKMDGVQAAGQILHEHDLPIVFLASDAETNMEEKTEHIMCYGVISKSSGIAILNATLKMALKLHKARMKEKARTEELEFQANILDQIGDHVTVTDPDGRIIYVNEAERKTVGKKKDEIIGKKTEVFGEDPEQGATQKEIVEATREEGSWRGEVVNFDSKNNRIVMDCRTWAMRDSNGVAHSFIGIASDITERKRTEEALRESEELLSKSQEIAHVGSWKLNLTDNENNLKWSDEVYRIFGCEPGEFAASYEAFLDFVHPDDRAAVDEAYSRSLQEGTDSYDIEHRIVRQNTGEVRHVHERCVHLRDNTGAVIESIGMVHDITERKQAEEALKESQDRLEAILRHSPLLISEFDFDGRYLLVNPVVEQFFKMPPNQVIGKTFSELLPPEITSIFMERIERVKRERAPISAEDNLQTDDGMRYFLTTLFPLKDHTGNIRSIGSIAHDITERKQAEEVIKASEEHLSATLRSIDDGVIACDSEGKVTYLNIAAEALTGWKSPEAAGLAVEEVFNIINAKTREGVENPVRRAIKEGISVDLANYTMLIARNGTEYQIADCCSPIRDISGAVTGAVLVFRDVTEEYRKRKALRESEEKYHALFNQSTEGIYLHDLEGRILDVNEVACEQSGYSREEWLGLTVFDGHPDQSTKNPPKEEILRIWSQWVPGQRFTVEAEHQRKDGAVYPVEISTGLVRYGNTNAMLAIVKDITDRKLAEQALEKSLKEKDVLLSEIHHRVKNNMAVISGMITLQTNYFPKKAPDKLLKDITTRIESMALVHEMVYEHQNFAEINAGKLLKRLAGHLQKIYQSKGRNITFEIRTGDIMLDMNKSVPFTLLVSEVVTNAFKHAFTDRKTGLIEVDLQKENGGYRLVIQDNGEGVSDMDQLHNPESFGWTIIPGLAQQLQGELAFSSPANGGLNVNVRFPE